MALTATATTFSQVEFDESGQQLTHDGASNGTRAIQYADMDDDGDVDLLVGLWETSMRVWLNNGSGTYTDSGFDGNGDADRINWLLAEDFDGDGHLDVMAVRGGNEPSTLWFNDGSGGLVQSNQTFPGGSHAAAGDLDDDGDIDVVFDSGHVYLNDGSGQFSELTELAGGAVGIGDLDGDNHADILFASATVGNVYFNDGMTPPEFVSRSQVPVPGLRSAELVDLDGDDDLDAVTHVGVFLNDGSGDFTEAQTWEGDVMEATVADVDQDGDVDVALALRGPDIFDMPNAPNEIWVNDGNASFADSGLQLGDNNASSVAFGDFDGDSDVDLIFGTGGGDYIYQHENVGDPWLIFRDRFESTK